MSSANAGSFFQNENAEDTFYARKIEVEIQQNLEELRRYARIRNWTNSGDAALATSAVTSAPPVFSTKNYDSYALKFIHLVRSRSADQFELHSYAVNFYSSEMVNFYANLDSIKNNKYPSSAMMTEIINQGQNALKLFQ